MRPAHVLYMGPALAGVSQTLRYVAHATRVTFEEKQYPQFRLALTRRSGQSVVLQSDSRGALWFEDAIQALAKRSPESLLGVLERHVAFLHEVDAVVFVADSQMERSEANIERLERLQRELAGVQRLARDVPVVFQCNKRDLPKVMPLESMREQLRWSVCEYVPSIARTGDGIFEALRTALAIAQPSSAPPYR